MPLRKSPGPLLVTPEREFLASPSSVKFPLKNARYRCDSGNLCCAIQPRQCSPTAHCFLISENRSRASGFIANTVARAALTLDSERVRQPNCSPSATLVGLGVSRGTFRAVSVHASSRARRSLAPDSRNASLHVGEPRKHEHSWLCADCGVADSCRFRQRLHHVPRRRRAEVALDRLIRICRACSGHRLRGGEPGTLW